MSNKERTETVEDNIKGILISNSGGTWEHGDKLLGDEVDINCCVKEIMEEWQKNLSGSCEGWISVKGNELPLEKPILVSHKYGIDAIMFNSAKWRFLYTGNEIPDEMKQTITHFLLPQPPKDQVKQTIKL